MFFAKGGNSVSGDAILGTNSYHPLLLRSNGNDKLIIDQNGRIGLGTISPVDPIEVVYNNVQPGFSIKNEDVNGKSGIKLKNSAGASRGQLYWDNNSPKMVLSSEDPSAPLSLQTSAVDRLVIKSTGQVGIGNNNPEDILHVSGGNVLSENEGSSAGFISKVFSSTSFNAPYIYLQRARGSKAAPSEPQSGDTLGAIIAQSAVSQSSYPGIYFTATENHNFANGGSKISFMTTPNLSNTPIERLTVDQNGTIGIGTTSPMVNVMLDIVSSPANKSAIRLPQGNIANRPTGSNGMIRFNNETFKFEAVENGASWTNIIHEPINENHRPYLEYVGSTTINITSQDGAIVKARMKNGKTANFSSVSNLNIGTAGGSVTTNTWNYIYLAEASENTYTWRASTQDPQAYTDYSNFSYIGAVYVNG
jgi:hypothetical protein